METGRVKKNTYFISISQVVQIGLSFILVPVAARYLGDEGFGRYSFAFIFSYFLYLVDDLGISTYVTREISKNRDQAGKYFLNGFFLKVLLIFVTVILLGIYLSVSSFPRDKMIVVAIFGGFGILYSFNQLNYAVFRAFERMEYEMAILMLEKLVMTILGIIVLIKGYGLIVFSWVFVISGFVSLITGLVIIKKKFIKRVGGLQFRFMKQMIAVSLLLGINMFLANIHGRLDTVILASMKGEDVVGWYASAMKLILVLDIIPTILVTATFPRISRGLKDKISNEDVSIIYSVGFKYLFYLAIPLIVGTLFIGDKIILLLYGDEFQNAGVVFRILIFAAAFNFFNIFFSGFLYAWNKQKELTYLQIGSIFLNVLFNLLLIPKYNQLGPAIASVISHGFGFIVGFLMIHRKLYHMQTADLIKPLFASAIMAGFLYFSRITLLLVILYVTGGIRLDEILIIKKSGTSNAEK
jgi:O-antigen/teichoic acid export membrane protein